MNKKFIYMIALLFIGVTATAQIDRSQPPKSGPTPEIKLGKPYTFELKNGMQVLVVEDRKLPTISFSLSLDNPPIVEGEKAGVVSLASSIMGKGTTEMSKEEFNEKVDFLGANLFVSMSGGYAGTLSKYTEEVFEMFADAALKPNFTQDELDFEKSQLIESIKSGENSAAAIAGRVRSALAYGKNHAAGEFATEETINNVTLQDVENYYNKYFSPSNAYMVISGDIKGKQAKKLVKKYFKDWEAKEIAMPQLPRVTDVDQRQINFVDVPNAVQTELAVIMVSDLKMNDPDYHAAVVANYILGGSFGSYLNMNLREENGYTYGARTSLGTGKNYKSTFRATAKVRNEVTDSAVVETMKEIKRIRDEYVDDEMLANAKAKFLGNFIMQSEDKSVVADRAVRIRTMDLPEDFYKNFIKNINAVTKEDVKRVANKYIKPEKARIVLVGKAGDVLENLEKMQIDGRPVPIKFYDKMAEPTERPSTVEIPAGLTAQDVLDSYIKAIGGEEAVSKIKSTDMFAVYTSPMGELVLEMKRANNDKFLQTVQVAGNVVQKQVYKDGKALMSAQGQTRELEGDEKMAVAAEALMFPELTAADKAELVKAERFDDSNVYIIKWSDTKNRYYDIQSGLLLAEENIMKTPQGEMSNVLRFEDYKEVEGVKFPMMLKQDMMGQTLSFEVKKMDVNSGLSDKDFE
ncbi:peptidase, M16 family protein [Nonlabens spongiae]|uniref:Peptidase, M16 family protein n=2 Tax=Nonlabens spongiae TaxID=331648 RepID=A0A1W6MPE4_9FLAO|nr:peptidase, M16 family protein [Nonlabens spongiae]